MAVNPVGADGVPPAIAVVTANVGPANPDVPPSFKKEYILYQYVVPAQSPVSEYAVAFAAKVIPVNVVKALVKPLLRT